MALNLADLKSHCNVTGEQDDQLLTRLLAASIAHAEKVLGFKFDDTTEFANGAPADVEQAVLMTAAHWFENREATLVGVAITAIPTGADDILRNHRRYTFALGADHVQ